MSAHTQRPWIAMDRMVFGPNGEHIANIPMLGGILVKPVMRDANVRLIVEAPEMYDLLRLFANLGDYGIREDLVKGMRPHEAHTLIQMIERAQSLIVRLDAPANPSTPA